MNPDTPDLILVDGHVHLRECFPVRSFVKSAHRHFARTMRVRYGRRRFVGCLFLTDAKNEYGFRRLTRKVGTTLRTPDPRREWRVRATDEEESVLLSSDQQETLFVVAGHQVDSSENLEVLAVGTRIRGLDARPASRIIREVADADGIPIVPWGAGKWLGSRREVLRRMLRAEDLPGFFVGDSANRPTGWPVSSLLAEAAERGIVNLPGTDPLPFRDEVRRPGSYGFVLDGVLSEDTPAQDLVRMLERGSKPMGYYGNKISWISFVNKQVSMQLNKYRARQ